MARLVHPPREPCEPELLKLLTVLTAVVTKKWGLTIPRLYALRLLVVGLKISDKRKKFRQLHVGYKRSPAEVEKINRLLNQLACIHPVDPERLYYLNVVLRRASNLF
jgi:hypothetical protein